jgi:TonB family protein
MRAIANFIFRLGIFLPTGVFAHEPVKDEPVKTVADALQRIETAHSDGAPDPRRARTLGNPGEWVTGRDYPARALRENWQGTVGFSLIINRTGRVDKCVVTLSSGYELLDITACDLITQRAVFKPATDRRNRPIFGSFSSRVRWIMPSDDLPPPSAFSIERTFILGPDGSITECRFNTLEGIPESEQAAMKMNCEKQKLRPVTDNAGIPVRRLIRSRSSVTIEPVP